jgi:hypothetical protein
MIRRILTVAALAAASTLFAAPKSHAQEFPGLGVGNLAAWNMAQDQRFFQNAWDGAQALARQIPNNVSSAEIAAAMNPHTTGNVYGGMNAGYWHNQAVQSAAMNNFSRHIRDEGFYTNPYSGQTYQMPYNAGGYYQDPAGWMYQGNHPTDFNNNFFYSE